MLKRNIAFMVFRNSIFFKKICYVFSDRLEKIYRRSLPEKNEKRLLSSSSFYIITFGKKQFSIIILSSL
ncbi:MAG: hypothetical protein DWB56_12220 [Candidatus Jettenia sp.]|nr:MAG: hypothetical protein EDM77_10675 [Candidatus Jettenia sp. AMX1]MBC6929703.1 hypothetical protein [Candidatus Jettenia sp.]MCE7881250.1 hypothetical protein [Candidatus Jettenia sp. AMX1]MCQ3928091.1 hypothetical protein [Candidatus Jettenia sp.]